MSALEDLLVVQEHDSAADRLRHKLDTLPEKARLAEVDQTLAGIDASMADVGRRRDDVVRRQQRHEAELATELDARGAAAAGIPEDLLSQYERLRAKQGGIGAARLVGNRCSGCHLTLPATELDRLRHQTPDVVVLCDQCGRILVR